LTTNPVNPPIGLLARLAIVGVPTLAIAAVATGILLAWRVSPLWLIIAGASVSWLISG
jgi:hypothetical protein